MAKKILTADDSPVIRKALARLFDGEAAYELCKQAQNGQEAIEIALQCKPDLIILDLSMPVKNGIQAAKELKTLMPNVPIFLFSMHVQAIEHGAENYIDVVVPKSQPNVLLNHVKAFLLNETRVRPRAI